MVRCKFVCSRVAESHVNKTDHQWEYEFHAVYGDSSPENKMFWKYTPSGQLKFSCMTQGPLFEVGKEYYLDLSAAPVAEPPGPAGS
jgi:hypothetical protein